MKEELMPIRGQSAWQKAISEAQRRSDAKSLLENIMIQKVSDDAVNEMGIIPTRVLESLREIAKK